MSARIRINVKFGDTKVLVPVGEGNITVEELIAKAIEKYRKFMKLVSEQPFRWTVRRLSHYSILVYYTLSPRV